MSEHTGSSSPTPPGSDPSRRWDPSPLGTPLLIAAAVGLVGAVVGWIVAPTHFYHAWLVAWVFCITLLLGMLFFVMLHHVTDAGWSTVIRRPAEQCLAALPVLIVLSIPILIGYVTSREFFKWTAIDPDYDPLIVWKGPYLNIPFFLIRVIIYFAAWWLLVHVMRGYSLRQDQTGDPQLSLSMRAWSAPGFIVYALTLTFAAFDLIMALDFHWYSTIFGVYVYSGAVLGSLGLLTLMVLWLGRGPLSGMIASDHLHDLGKLLFAFAVFWAYIAFSQFFLIWYANIPEATLWFIERWRGTEGDSTWWIVTVLVTVGRFVIPFVLLMSAIPKRSPMMLAVMSVLMLVIHYLDIYWMVMPVPHHHGPALAWIWIDLSALLLIGGASAWIVLRALASHPLYPVHDPRLHEAVGAQHG